MKLNTASLGTIKLTRGELNALGRFLSQNGTSIHRVQYDPGYVSYITVRNLISKGVLVRAEGNSLRVAPGIFEPIVRYVVHNLGYRYYGIWDTVTETYAKTLTNSNGDQAEFEAFNMKEEI